MWSECSHWWCELNVALLDVEMCLKCSSESEGGAKLIAALLKRSVCDPSSAPSSCARLPASFRRNVGFVNNSRCLLLWLLLNNHFLRGLCLVSFRESIFKDFDWKQNVRGFMLDRNAVMPTNEIDLCLKTHLKMFRMAGHSLHDSCS